ncbi:rCG47310, partial [Rattus norvegicus]
MSAACVLIVRLEPARSCHASSRFPALTSFYDGLWCGSESEVNPFSPKPVMMLCHSN